MSSHPCRTCLNADDSLGRHALKCLDSRAYPVASCIFQRRSTSQHYPYPTCGKEGRWWEPKDVSSA